jgi:hypothetical protein
MSARMGCCSQVPQAWSSKGSPTSCQAWRSAGAPGDPWRSLELQWRFFVWSSRGSPTDGPPWRSPGGPRLWPNQTHKGGRSAQTTTCAVDDERNKASARGACRVRQLSESDTIRDRDAQGNPLCAGGVQAVTHSKRVHDSGGAAQTVGVRHAVLTTPAVHGRHCSR